MTNPNPINPITTLTLNPFSTYNPTAPPVEPPEDEEADEAGLELEETPGLDDWLDADEGLAEERVDVMVVIVVGGIAVVAVFAVFAVVEEVGLIVSIVYRDSEAMVVLLDAAEDSLDVEAASVEVVVVELPTTTTAVEVSVLTAEVDDPDIAIDIE